MTQKELDRRWVLAKYLAKHACNMTEAALVFIETTAVEQTKLDSLVHFCQTGKFLDEQPANKQLS